jgi:hypothetical protein
LNSLLQGIEQFYPGTVLLQNQSGMRVKGDNNGGSMITACCLNQPLQYRLMPEMNAIKRPGGNHRERKLWKICDGIKNLQSEAGKRANLHDFKSKYKSDKKE